MGMIVSVYRSHLGDCTNEGISSTAQKLCVINVPGPFSPQPDMPAAKLERHMPGALRIVPVDRPARGVGPMFGGNYASTSDSRFSEACRQLLGADFYGAVAIHDRFEIHMRDD